jgi:amino acid transporter
MKIILITLSVFALVFIASPNLGLASFAAPDAQLPAKGALPDPEISGLFGGTSFMEAVVLIINWSLGFIGIIVFIIFLFAGFEYATAGGDEKKAESAQKRMANAIIGLIIIFFAFVASNAILSFVFEPNNNTNNSSNNTNNSSNNTNNSKNSNNVNNKNN